MNECYLHLIYFDGFFIHFEFNFACVKSEVVYCEVLSFVCSTFRFKSNLFVSKIK